MPIKGANPCRTRAYFRAADSLAALAQPLHRIITARALTEIPGIGDSIADILTKLYETGYRSVRYKVWRHPFIEVNTKKRARPGPSFQ
jgi:DNA polymerase/3'-5' exonuclease PolX